MKRQVAEILDDVVDRLERIEANQGITNKTVQDVAQVTASTNRMVRKLYDRLIEKADRDGKKEREQDAEIRDLKKAVGTNGRG